MITFLGSVIAEHLVNKKIVPPEFKEIYQYGSELIISTIFSIIMILIVGILSGRFIECIVFYIVFCLLRRNTGGYHANSYWGCKITLFVVLSSALVLELLLYKVTILYWGILLIFNCVLIIYLSPIEHINKPLSDIQKMKNRKNTIIELLIISCLTLVMMLMNIELYHIIILSVFSVSILMLITKIPKKEEMYYE
ncbi:MAG: accessory gene regulator B family protein [Ruminococcus sp.]|nr:accessory gene regulator B family protein [Ruminococcus sp.]